MNERMLQLAKDAGYTKDMFGVGHWDMPECQKFAKLIIEECADIVENSPWRLKRGYKAIDQANLLKQHFGVE